MGRDHEGDRGAGSGRGVGIGVRGSRPGTRDSGIRESVEDRTVFGHWARRSSLWHRPEPLPTRSGGRHFSPALAQWENIAQGSHSSLAAFPPRRGFDDAAKMFEERYFGRGQKKFGFPCLLRGHHPRRWKSRRAVPRALRYHAGSCLISLASHNSFMGLFRRFRVSINHRQVGTHRAFWAPALLLPFLERARPQGITP